MLSIITNFKYHILLIYILKYKFHKYFYKKIDKKLIGGKLKNACNYLKRISKNFNEELKNSLYLYLLFLKLH